MERELDRLKNRPLERGNNPRRTAQLQPPLSSKNVGGQKLPQWQHEITGGGRIWYCPDKAARKIWVSRIELTHPKETE